MTHPLLAFYSFGAAFALGYLRAIEQRERKSAEVIILAAYRRAK